jgi:hypothetical protein
VDSYAMSHNAQRVLAVYAAAARTALDAPGTATPAALP